MKPKFMDCGDGVALACPKCGNYDLHHDQVTVFNRMSEDSELCSVITVGRDDVVDRGFGPSVDSPSPRRDALAIEFRCEHCDQEGTLQTLNLSQHKGQTLLWWT